MLATIVCVAVNLDVKWRAGTSPIQGITMLYIWGPMSILFKIAITVTSIYMNSILLHPWTISKISSRLSLCSIKITMREIRKQQESANWLFWVVLSMISWSLYCIASPLIWCTLSLLTLENCWYHFGKAHWSVTLLTIYHLGTRQLWLETLGKRMGRLLLMQHHSSHHPFIVYRATQWKRFPVDIKPLNTSIISLGLDWAFFDRFFPQNTGRIFASLSVGSRSFYKDASWVPSCKKRTHSLFNLWRSLRIFIINGKLIASTSAACASTHCFMLLWRSYR